MEVSPAPKKSVLIFPQISMRIMVFPSFWQSPTSSQYTVNWSLGSDQVSWQGIQRIQKKISWWSFPIESPICACIDFFLHFLYICIGFFYILPLLYYPTTTMMLIVLKFLCRQIFAYVTSWQTAVLMLLNPCLLIDLNILGDPQHLWLLCFYSESSCQEYWYCIVLVSNRGGHLPFPHFLLQERDYVTYMPYLLLFLSLPKIAVPFSVPPPATGFSFFLPFLLLQ